MEINIVANGKQIVFRLDRKREEYVARVLLDEWAGYRSENATAENTEGRISLICCEYLGDDDKPRIAGVQAYSRAAEWFFGNRPAIQAAVLPALLEYAVSVGQELKAAGYEIEGFDTLSSTDQLKNILTLCRVYFHPFHREGRPYLGLEFECDWDPEHACGVMLHGNEVRECGMSGTASGVEFDISQDGGVI